MLLQELKKINIICGHYGCGKTNFAINLALYLADLGKRVTLVDLDIVNPYFRSGDYKQFLTEKGIQVLAPNFVNTNLDLPSIPAQMNSVFSDNSDYVIVDLGGDDAGASALGRFRSKITESEDYRVFYMINRYRLQTSQICEGVEVLREIESAIKLKADGIINNSHLQGLTRKEDIIKGYAYAVQMAEAVKLPLIATTYPREILYNYNQEITQQEIANLFPVNIIVKLPF